MFLGWSLSGLGVGLSSGLSLVALRLSCGWSGWFYFWSGEWLGDGLGGVLCVGICWSGDCLGVV